MQVEKLYALLGNPGKFHVLVFLLMESNWWPVNHGHLIMAFFGATPPHHCAAGNSTYLYGNGSVLDYEPRPHGSCHVYTADNQSIACPNGYEYDVEPGEKTIVTEWDLVCDKKFYKGLATSIYFVGVMLGGILFGALADRFGRRPVILFTLLTPVPIGVGLSFVENYILFVVLRFLLGMLYQGLQTTSFVLLLECARPKFRTICGTGASMFWAVGAMWIALVSFLLKDWHYIQLVICLPSALMACQIWLVPESPRWLIAHKRFDEAKKFFVRAGKFNNVQIPEDAFESEKLAECSDNSGDTNTSRPAERRYTILDLFRTPKLRKRSLVAYFIWFSMSFGYYGISFSISSFAGNKYLNFFVGALLELIAYIIATFVLLRFGRPRPLTVYLLCAGVLCITAGCVPKQTADGVDIRLLTTVLALAGRFSIASCFSIMFLYTSELFPTVLRNLGVGSCAFWTRFGAVMAPQMLQIGHHTIRELPIIIFGCFALVGGFLAFLLPETLGRPLPDRIEDVEASFKTDQSSKDHQVMIGDGDNCIEAEEKL